ncbi:lipoprotein LipO [Spirochaetia bacterium]|nr:lipoprotein LipO [Spirochaetia bacterium]GHU31158.1 lipoprotein LipO [Spirochaetia bacterium]
MKKTMGALLAIVLLAGCGGKKADGGKVIEAEPGPVGKYKEPLSLSWGVNASSVQKFLNNDTYENNIWSRKIKQDLNIDVTIAFTANWETQAYQNQLNLALASGDLPDLLRIDNYRQFRQAVDAGYLADITDAFNQYAGEDLKQTLDKYSSSFDYIKVNGRMYGIPPFNGNEQMAPLLWIRDDWLKNVGMEAPRTVEEMVAVARAFTFNDPDRNGRNDTYGLGLQKLINIRDHGTIGGLLAAFGIPNHAYDVYYPGKDGKLTFSYIQPEVKEALQVLQDMYKEGLIDPEFITTDMTKVQQDIARGRFGMAYGPQWGTWSPWNYAYNAENNWAVTHAYPIPTKAGYTPKYGYNSNKAAGEIVVINSRVKNPEAVVKLVNHYMAFNNDFQNDADRLAYNDQEQYRFDPAWVAEPQEVRVQPILYDALTRSDPSGLAPVIKDWYNKILAFNANPIGHDPDTYGRWGQYDTSMAMTIIMNQYKPSGNMVESSLGAEQPQSLIDFDASLQKITDQVFTEIITGQRPVSYFDTYVQDWLKAGGQKILDDLENIYGTGAK